ncbi:MAG: hypothetical protein M8353_01360 [ANME-2 cluster archaeon]|nr:hypothetical protein [ANME-2 cluster archaeon]
MYGPDFAMIIDIIEFINHYIIIPLTILTFAMLVYFVIFIRRNDPDIIKSNLFLRFDEFKSAFRILAVAAFVLIFHVLLIYLHYFIDMSLLLEWLNILSNLQQLLGLLLTFLLLFFAIKLMKVVK